MAAVSRTAKETVEYDGKFLADWNLFCDTKGYVKRQASHACRIAFMALSAAEREKIMQESMEAVLGKKLRAKA